ncbi:MAG: B12-binding domain-containing radical SAM protein [Deltaproteobacteria bacterium]|nr:B12-binding domain-containing radical SAM protein [Deltaproteobacteria bacterium]
MKVLFVYPRFARHADHHPELREHVPMNEYLGSPSLGMAQVAALLPPGVEVELRDDRVRPADRETDADIVALSFFTPAATRALELAGFFRARGKTVIAGGIFPTAMPEVVVPHVDAVVVGEAEASFPRLLDDFVRRQPLAKIYRAEADVDPTTIPVPRLEMYFDAEDPERKPDDYPVQISRGCPLRCTACILPVSMTSRLRVLPTDHVIAQLDKLAAANKRAALTEDTSWFPTGSARTALTKLLDRLILDGRRALVSYVGISIPMILSTPASILSRAKTAGIDMFYLVTGFDPVTNGAFGSGDSRASARFVDAVKKALDLGIEPYTSFLIGGDDDDGRSVDRMLELSAKAGVRKAEFAVFTPYPGTPSWERMVKEDRIITSDWARFNDANVVFQPKAYSPEKLTAEYVRAWKDFYSSRQHYRDAGQAERTIQF